MTFSERMGIVERSTLLQRDSMSEELRNSLWNVLDQVIWRSRGFLYQDYGDAEIYAFSRALWFHYFKRPADERPGYASLILGEIREYFFEAPWNEVYDFIEFVLGACPPGRYGDLRRYLNGILERELSGFRLIDDKFVPITDEHEIEEIAESLTELPFSGARRHLARSLALMSDRNEPDYRNSIKEAISAVESAAREITGNNSATLGDALREIENNGVVHGALRRAFSSLYGYTSDEEGIRHAMTEEPNIDFIDAKYFLVSCAAFLNYLAAKFAR